MVTAFDLKNCLHRIIKEYKYSLTIVASMSLGLAVFLFLFSQIYAKGYANLPFENGEKIVYVSRLESGLARLNGGLQDYDINYFLKRQKSLLDAAAYENRQFTIATQEITRQVNGVATSSVLFSLIKTKPVLGRALLPTDDAIGAEAVVVIGYEVWKDVFHGDTDIIGRPVQLDGRPVNVVGVMPKGFRFPLNDEIWMSYQHPDLPAPSGEGWSAIAGILKDHVSIEQAREEFQGLAEGIANEYPTSYAGKSVDVQYYTQAYSQPISLLLNIMAVVAASILLMSCVSIVNLIWVRLLEGGKEFAIKTALGLPSSRIVAGPLLESFILCFSAGLMAVMMSFLAIHFFADKVSSPFDPFWWEVETGWVMAGAGAIFSLFAWFVTGIIPLLLVARKPRMTLLSGGRKGGGTKSSGAFMGALIALQIGSAFVLMVFTGICIVSLFKVANADYGVSPDGYLTAWVQLSEASYPELEDRLQYYERLEERLENDAAVDSVSFAGALPGSYSYMVTYDGVGTKLAINGVNPKAIEIPISKNFFENFNVPVVSGRAFLDIDTEANEPVVIVSQTVNNRLAPGGSLVGQKIQLNPERGGSVVTVVGVVPDLIYGPPVSLYEMDLDVLYRPMSQVMPSWSGMAVAVKSAGDPYDLEGVLLQAGRDVDSQVAVSAVMSYPDLLKQNGRDFASLVYSFLPATIIAFLMSALGIYAISARTVVQKSVDIGIMKALGIDDSIITRLFVISALKKIGLGLGMGGTVLVLFAPNILKQIVVVDAAAMAYNGLLAAAFLTSVALVASVLPLKRVHQAPPSSALAGSCQ